MTTGNLLYYGDNLDVLRRHVEKETVDLVYLDPPFNSNASYNVLFAEQSGERSAAQIKAFDDTWTWDQAAAAAYQDTVEAGGKVSQVMQAFRTFLGDTNMLAYLAMMAPRLAELRRVLKPTGSIYLHCDPTASHYLKMLMDAVFGPKYYRNEITWKRSSAHSDTKQGMRRCGKIRDVILFYTKGDTWTWNPQFTPYTKEYVESEYRHRTPEGRHYQEGNPTAAKPGGDTEYEWRVKRLDVDGSRWEADLEEEYKTPRPGMEYKGVQPYNGRYWAYSKQNMIDFAKQGCLAHRSTGAPRIMLFADEMPGIPLQDLWDDIPPESGKDDLGYPTQKPEALLERIIKASSNEGDLVLDPFCGCGTTIAVAQRLNRRWIGIDITHLAVTLMKARLKDAFGDQLAYQVIGEPVSLPDAEDLATQDPYQFQWWALGLVGARPVEQKKGADKGIDGRIYFHDEGAGGKTKQVILSVKAGQNVGVSMVRDLGHVVSREKAEIGALITMQAPTQPMKTEAAGAGFYHSPYTDRNHPRLQILTVADLLAGKGIDMPPISQTSATFKKAPMAKGEAEVQKIMSLDTV